MEITRREFMGGVGVAMVSLLAARCGQPTCYVPPPPPTSASTPPLPDGDAGEWDLLRRSWYALDSLATEARQDFEKAEKTRGRLEADHQAALAHLVAAGALQSGVADAMQIAFEAAAYHVWRLNSPITCYEAPIGPDYYVQGSSDLARQAEMLEEMASRSEVDPETANLARSAIERDVAFLSLTPDAQRAIEQHIMDAINDQGEFPDLAQVDMEVPPESVQAAQILVALLLGQSAE